MGITVKPTLKTDHKKLGDVYAVRIRITLDRQVRYYTTAYSLKKGDWNPKGTEEKLNWVRTSHRDSLHINEDLEALVKKFRKIGTDNPHYTAEQVRDAYGRVEETGKTGFIAFAREWIRRKHAMGQDGMAVTYETNLNYFLDFWGQRPDEPALLTPAMVGELVGHLRTRNVRGREGYDPSTINVALRYFRTFFKHAILEGWLPPMPNPFNVQPLAQHEKPVERPTVEQILSLMQAHTSSRVQRHARNVFLLQYFLNGARVSEVFTLRWEDVSAQLVSYHPKKKAKGRKIIQRHEGIEWVLGQYKRHAGYIFPYITPELDKLRGKERVRLMQRIGGDINGALQRLCKHHGLPHLTTHMQRHTLAEEVWRLTKSIRAVQGVIGHTTSNSTEVYMKRFGNEERDQINTRLYGGIGGNNGETLSPEQGGTYP